jgi:hypothetical protein
MFVLYYIKTRSDNSIKTFPFLTGNSEKYLGIIHQRDVWHGGKNIGKKVTSVCFHIFD